MDSLCFMTCGSVDDGKSTLLGRLLHDTQHVFADQIDALKADSRAFGTRGADIDFALLVDGLAAEREQGITIDVAYRYFSTSSRRFIVADAPGHEQYTRNMATAASQAEAAIVLVDARAGLTAQSFRHSRIAHLFGVRQLALAVNKMDLVGWSRTRFEAIAAEYAAFIRSLGLESVVSIPVCATQGVNIARRGEGEASWYDGPLLLDWLEKVPACAPAGTRGFAMSVQWVNRPDADFRGYAGRVSSGMLSVGGGGAPFARRPAQCGQPHSGWRRRLRLGRPRPVRDAGSGGCG